jgi:sporulation protein YlmC with PRC-barrel domain
MRPERLNGKEVIDTTAQVVGEIAGVELDLSTWKVTHICVDLSDSAVEALGYKKPFIGKVQIDIPIETVKMAKDIIALNKSVKDLKSLVERHRK